MRRHPFVVVGAGPAGIAAAAEAARQGVRPLLIDASGVAGGTIAVAHEVRNIPFLPDRVPGEAVASHLASFLQRWDITVSRGRVRAIGAIGDAVLVGVDELGDIVADRVVVATGTRAVHPRIPGLGDDFSYPLADSAPMAWERGAPAKVAVVGGGDVAFDQARWCAARGATVTLLCRSARPRAPAWLVEAAEREGVEVVRSAAATAGRRERGRVVLTLAREGAEAAEATFDAIVAAVGRAANTIEGQSSMPASKRVAIAGDVRGWRARHVVAAMGDGCVAAMAVLGDVGRSSGEGH